MPSLSRTTERKEVNPRAKRLLVFIRDFCETNRYGPTLVEMMAGANLSSTAVASYNVDVLIRAGYIEKVPNISRGIRMATFSHPPKYEPLIAAAIAICVIDREDITNSHIRALTRALDALGVDLDEDDGGT